MSTGNDEYEGPSKIGNAYAKAAALSPVAWTGAAVGGVATAVKTLKSENPETLGQQLAAIKKSTKRGTLVGIGVLGATTALGAIWGWNQAAKSQDAFAAIKGERDNLKNENAHLQGVVSSIRQATSFADREQPHPNSFTDKLANEPSPSQGRSA